MAQFTLVYNEDWIGLYRDGVLRIEDHTLEAYSVIVTVLGLPYSEADKQIDAAEISTEEMWNSWDGRMPPTWPPGKQNGGLT